MVIARINDVDLYYEVQGSGDSLFLTHGAWGDATAWHGVVPRLARRFEVVTWDRRGHSRSSDGQGPGSHAEDAADLAALIEYLDRQRSHVYGSSSGGTVVLHLLARRPDLVSSAMVHEPAVMRLLDGVDDPEVSRLLAVADRHLGHVRQLIERGEWTEAAEYFIDNVAVGPGAWASFPEEVKAGFVGNAGTFGDDLAAPSNHTIDVEALNAIDLPLMITMGTESPPMILAGTRELIRLLPSARPETLDGVGHVPYRTHPDIWLESVVTYLESVATGQAVT